MSTPSGTPPIDRPPPRLRQRRRRNGGWRIWWEPETALREAGFTPVELDPDRLTWSVRRARELNDAVDQARGRAPQTRRRVGGKTVADTITAYRKSPGWDQLAEATRASYAASFRIIEQKWGAFAVADFTPDVVYTWYETTFRTSGPSQAAQLVRVLSVLMRHARRRGWIAVNPCLQLGVTQPRPRSRVATWAEIDALVAEADRTGLGSVALAIELAVYQGQRETDIVHATTAEFQGEQWFLLRSKRGTRGALDLHPQVLPRLREMLRAARWRSHLLVYERTGAPYKDINAFGRVFAAVRNTIADRALEAGDRDLAGIRSLQFRDLRRTAGHLARIGGASERDVADMLGNGAWKDPALSQTYMPANAETASRAVRSIKR